MSAGRDPLTVLVALALARRMTVQVTERALEPARIVLGLAPFQNDVTVTVVIRCRARHGDRR